MSKPLGSLTGVCWLGIWIDPEFGVYVSQGLSASGPSTYSSFSSSSISIDFGREITLIKGSPD